jgi:methylmalonyl-CoA mutase cobalamin-binding domain/chain
MERRCSSVLSLLAAVALLQPHMVKAGATGRAKARIVLATVSGDVHDIGKNLVDIILTNNGYKVVNLGIKVPLTEIVAAAREHKANAIGMSGLLVKSTVVMRENLEEMSRQGVDVPVLLGGAALQPAGAARPALAFEIVYGHAFRPAPRPRLAAETQVDLEDMRSILRSGSRP